MLDPPLLRFFPLLNKQHVQIPIRCRKCLQLSGNTQEGHRSTSSRNCQMSPSLKKVCFCFVLFEKFPYSHHSRFDFYLLVLLASPKETNKAKNIQGGHIKIWREKKIKIIKERMKVADRQRHRNSWGSQSQRTGLITLCMTEGPWISIGVHLLMVISYVSKRGGSRLRAVSYFSLQSYCTRNPSTRTVKPQAAINEGVGLYPLL